MFLRSLTNEAMGIWRFAGAFAVVKLQSESKISAANCKSAQLMREQNGRNARQPADTHDVYLGFVAFTRQVCY